MQAATGHSSVTESAAESAWGSDSVHRLLDRLPAGAYTCDRDGLITYFNRQAAELWGRAPRLNDPADRYCGSFKLYLNDGKPIPHQQCWMARALETGHSFNGEEIVVQRPDGARLTVLAYANPLRDDTGRLIGGINVLVDTSDLSISEETKADLLMQFRELVPQVFQMFAQLDKQPNLSVRHKSAGVNSNSSTAIQTKTALAKHPQFASHRILIVDDTAAASYMLGKLLEMLGQRVRTANSGQAALEAVEAEVPDLIISDIGMPELDGYELARRLRQNPKLNRTPLVALTGHSQTGDQERAQAAGFDRYFLKPIGLETLQKLLTSLPEPHASSVPLDGSAALRP